MPQTCSAAEIRLAELVLEARVLYEGGVTVCPANTVYGLLKMLEWIANDHDLFEMKMLEVGSNYGVSTEVFAIHFGLVHAVDLGFPQRFFDRLSKYNNVMAISGRSPDVAKQFEDGTFDLIYIDAEHSYDSVKADILGWLPKVKKHGFIAGHDYSEQESNGGVIKAVNEVLGEPDRVFEDTSWIKYIT